MPEARSLRMRLTVAGEEALSPNDFIGLFECAEDLSRALVEQDALNLLEHLGFSAESRLQIMQRIHHLGRRLPTPVEVEEIERGSWTITVLLASPVLLFILKNYVHPVVKEALDDSHLKEIVVEFLRDRVFSGAKRKVEEKVVTTSQYRNLTVKAVEELPQTSPTDLLLEVRLERRVVIEVRASDKQLLEDFIERLRAGRSLGQ